MGPRAGRGGLGRIDRSRASAASRTSPDEALGSSAGSNMRPVSQAPLTIPGLWVCLLRAGRSGGRSVEVLQQLVGRKLDVLVAPLGSSIHACDQAGAMDPAEVAVHECVPGLGLLCDAV